MDQGRGGTPRLTHGLHPSMNPKKKKKLYEISFALIVVQFTTQHRCGSAKSCQFLTGPAIEYCLVPGVTPPVLHDTGMDHYQHRQPPHPMTLSAGQGVMENGMANSELFLSGKNEFQGYKWNFKVSAYVFKVIVLLDDADGVFLICSIWFSLLWGFGIFPVTWAKSLTHRPRMTLESTCNCQDQYQDHLLLYYLFILY